MDKLNDDVCCICQQSIANRAIDIRWKEGNNAEPVMRGRCCDVCNDTTVVPLRILLASHRARNAQQG